ncbi:hypothetical protein [Aureliella helgolandensis]|nr:hypothetical protein [Aureliella helgolandensis]
MQSMLAAEPTNGSQRSKGLLIQPTGIPLLNTRAKIVMELEGKLLLEEPDPSKSDGVREAEVKGKSTLDYFEKIAFEDSALTAAGRRYVEAKVENWISGSASSQELRPECRETRLLKHDGKWQQFSENEALMAREVELVQSPVNSAALELLLPTEAAKPNATWELSPSDAAQVFNLEAVHRSTVTAKIAKVEKGKATVELSGELQATANSVPTTLKIQGNLHVELASQTAFITWLGLVIKEERDISQTEPGFVITARIRLIRTETKDELQITDAELRQLAKTEDPGRWLIRLKSTAGRYTLLADRRWSIYIDGGEEAILRMVEKNSIIAQCNITRLTKLDEGTQLTLEGLQADIKQSLGKSFESFLESSEKVTSSKLRLMRCVAMGVSEDVPIQWVYCHLSDDHGQRLALIYTMGGNVTDRFAAADEQMTSSFEMLAAPAPTDVPTPAPQVSSKPTQAPR